MEIRKAIRYGRLLFWQALEKIGLNAALGAKVGVPMALASCCDRLGWKELAGASRQIADRQYRIIINRLTGSLDKITEAYVAQQGTPEQRTLLEQCRYEEVQMQIGGGE